MLSQESNEILTRVGPATPMGTLLRHFWMPALLEEEVARPDGDPVRLRLLGEDLVAFRDTNGRIGIIAEHCAHRSASLFFGRNEECGLRCVYHGWKYDVDGNCVDIPSEPGNTDALKRMAKLTAYRTALRGGVVWVYMGPAEFAAEAPAFEWSLLPPRQRTATKRLQRCNWAQAVEGGIDSSHISFLHNRTDTQQKPENPREIALKHWGADRHPTFEIKDTRHGLLIGARRAVGDDTYYWRITQFLLPFYTMIPPRNDDKDSRDAFYYGHAWVPIDDQNTWSWSFSANPHREYSDAESAWHGGRDGHWGPVDAQYRPLRNLDNDYLIDRERQRRENFTGIDGIPNQDSAVQESMGAVVDRRRELLGQSDRAIVRFRRLILDLAQACDAGNPPEAALHGDWYRVRSASVFLPRNESFDQAAAWLLSADRRNAAE